MSEEITLLKEENERFKAIIDILLKENKQLQAEISHLAGNAGKVRDDTSYDAIKEGKFPGVISLPALNGRKQAPVTSYHFTNEGNREFDISLLTHQLRKEMLTSRDIGLKNAARLLIHFATQPQNTHKHLATITSITMSGLAKHIYMLKKRGLIVRSGFQTYSLTPKSIAILQKSIPTETQTASTPA